jgi:uncharacterized protein
MAIARTLKFSKKKVPSLIAVIHLPPLAGAPLSNGLLPAEALDRAGMLAIQEAQILEQAGFNGLILENFGDSPFYKNQVPPETIASFSVIAAAVRQVTNLFLGINILRNDAFSALAIAAVTGCDLIRVNVLSGVSATDQGLLEGEAAFLLREKKRLGVDVSILADALVKHSKALSTDDLILVIEELVERSHADGIILTGSTTGRSISEERLKTAYLSAKNLNTPLYVGSGVHSENISKLKPWSDGIIVSSDLRRGGRAGEPLDLKRVKAFIKAWQACKTRPHLRSTKK